VLPRRQGNPVGNAGITALPYLNAAKISNPYPARGTRQSEIPAKLPIAARKWKDMGRAKLGGLPGNNSKLQKYYNFLALTPDKNRWVLVAKPALLAPKTCNFELLRKIGVTVT